MTNVIFPSIAHATPGGAKIGVKAGVLDGLLNAGPMVQFLVLLMIVLSVVSWAIIFAKYRQFNLLRDANNKFSEKFWKATSLERVFEKINDDARSSMAHVFSAAFLELRRLADSSQEGTAANGTPASGTAENQVRLYGLDNLERTVRKTIDTEIAIAEAGLNFLATTGSTAPFIGLLGTVIGIMTSFGHIAASGSASLAVVAPGISEALFSTAVGLFAALPAVAAYNYYVSQIRKIEMDLNNFGTDFLNITKRNFFRD